MHTSRTCIHKFTRVHYSVATLVCARLCSQHILKLPPDKDASCMPLDAPWQRHIMHVRWCPLTKTHHACPLMHSASHVPSLHLSQQHAASTGEGKHAHTYDSILTITHITQAPGRALRPLLPRWAAPRKMRWAVALGKHVRKPPMHHQCNSATSRARPQWTSRSWQTRGVGLDAQSACSHGIGEAVWRPAGQGSSYSLTAEYSVQKYRRCTAGFACG
jgi:hypothetical protein